MAKVRDTIGLSKGIFLHWIVVELGVKIKKFNLRKWRINNFVHLATCHLLDLQTETGTERTGVEGNVSIILRKKTKFQNHSWSWGFIHPDVLSVAKELIENEKQKFQASRGGN